MRGLVRPLVRSIYRTFIYTPFVPIPSLLLPASFRGYFMVLCPVLARLLPGFAREPCPLAILSAPCHPERSEGSIRRTSYPAATVCTENRPPSALSLYIQIRNRPQAPLPATVCTEKRPPRALSVYIQIRNRLLCRKIGLFGCLRARKRPFRCSSPWFWHLRARNTPFWCSSSVTGAPGKGKVHPLRAQKIAIG